MTDKKKKKAAPAGSNPVLEGIVDETRCRLFEGGTQCARKSAEGGPFCPEHQAWVAQGRLVSDYCPVIHEVTVEQCDRPAHGEKGSGRGYCSKHYQGARRGTPLGTETRRRPVGSGASRIYVSFRFTNAKWLAEELRLREGMAYECDVYKKLVYEELIRKGYGQRLMADEASRQDLQRLGLTGLLEKSAA